MTMTHTIEVGHMHRGELIMEQRPGRLLHTERTSSGEAAWCIVWVDGGMRFVPPEAVQKTHVQCCNVIQRGLR